MSVIVGRALPEVRDGLKPVHRRVLFAMYDQGFRPDRGYVKCARPVAEVMGNYHPHGDSAIYDALVRLAQPWSMRYPLIDGQGNFGSPGNDPAAAMRYTECRLTPLAMEMLAGIDEETVDFQANYDGRTQEPRGPARAHPQPADQRLGRHRGRHGHEHAAAQPARGRRRRLLDARPPRGRARGGPHRLHGADQGPRLPDPRAHRRPRGHRGRLPHRPRLGEDARRRHRGGGLPRPGAAGRHRAALPGQPGQPRRGDRRGRSRRAGSRASARSPTSPATASAAGWSSRCAGTPSPRSC